MANTKGKNDQIKRKATDIRSIYIRSPKVPAQIIETSKVAFVFPVPVEKSKRQTKFAMGQQATVCHLHGKESSLCRKPSRAQC